MAGAERRGLPVVAGAVPTKTPLQIVEEARAIQWWIDEQIRNGKTDEWIATWLPHATAYIIGAIPMSHLLETLAARRG